MFNLVQVLFVHIKHVATGNIGVLALLLVCVRSHTMKYSASCHSMQQLVVLHHICSPVILSCHCGSFSSLCGLDKYTLLCIQLFYHLSLNDPYTPWCFLHSSINFNILSYIQYSLYFPLLLPIISSALFITVFLNLVY